MKRLLICSICLLLVAGCGGRSVSTANNHNGEDAAVDPPDSAVVYDAEVQPDAAVTCEVEDSWELMATPLDGITVLNPALGGNGIPEGVTVRIEAGVTFTGCDQLAGVKADVFPPDQTVILTGFVWRYTGNEDCPSMLSHDIERIALRRLPAGNWEIWDYMVNGPSVDFWIRNCSAAEDCQCDAWQGIPGDWGAACDFDCMCQERLGCVMDGSGGCYRTCSVTSDCPIQLFCNEFLPQTSVGVCLSTGLLDSCVDSGDCAPGFDCLPVEGADFNWCLATMPLGEVGVPCAFDCDCAAGMSCLALRAEEGPTCQIKCRGNQDCPRPTLCDDPGIPGGFNRLVCQ